MVWLESFSTFLWTDGESRLSLCLKYARNMHSDFIVRVLFLLQNLSMSYIEFNPNPTGRKVGDCAVRAVAKALDVDWETAYKMIANNGLAMGDMPSSDSVWGSVLRQNGFYRRAVPNYCPDCYTARDFADDHFHGVYVLGFGGHVATVVDGDLYDSWDSSAEIPQYFWYRKED